MHLKTENWAMCGSVADHVTRSWILLTNTYTHTLPSNASASVLVLFPLPLMPVSNI